MAFTVEDFHDLIELLAHHPEWRAELRRHVLSDELLELPALVRQLAEAQARTDLQIAELVAAQQRMEVRLERVEARLEKVEARLEGVETRLDRMDTRFDRMDTRFDRMDDRFDRMDTRMDRMDDRVGDLVGKSLEQDFTRRGPTYLTSIARRLRVIEAGPLADLLDDAVDNGRLTESERETVLLADSVLTGRRRDDGQEIYLVVEVSGRIDAHAVERAAERAALLEKLGRPVLPVVAGTTINPDVAALAQDRGVWCALGGRVTAPRSA